MNKGKAIKRFSSSNGAEFLSPESNAGNSQCFAESVEPVTTSKQCRGDFFVRNFKHESLYGIAEKAEAEEPVQSLVADSQLDDEPIPGCSTSFNIEMNAPSFHNHKMHSVAERDWKNLDSCFTPNPDLKEVYEENIPETGNLEDEHDIEAKHKSEEEEWLNAFYPGQEYVPFYYQSMEDARNFCETSSSGSDDLLYLGCPRPFEWIVYIEERENFPNDLLASTNEASNNEPSPLHNNVIRSLESLYNSIHMPLHQPYSELWISRNLEHSSYIVNYIRIDQVCEGFGGVTISAFAKLDMLLDDSEEAPPQEKRGKRGVVRRPNRIPIKSSIPVRDNYGEELYNLHFKFHPEIFLPDELEWQFFKKLSNGCEIFLIKQKDFF